MYHRKHYVISELLVQDLALWAQRALLHSLGQKVQWKIGGKEGKRGLVKSFPLRELLHKDPGERTS